ncbi:MAG: hypothetical protein ACXAEL_06615 [Candidatus Hodarchaeales archaeon]|jgi:hypothetical protein
MDELVPFEELFAVKAKGQKGPRGSTPRSDEQKGDCRSVALRKLLPSGERPRAVHTPAM